jgi:tetratricopeptide (TPR) repeat protein
MFQLICSCGKKMTVQGSRAGCSVTCDCGKENRVPALSVLKLNQQNGEATPLVDIATTDSKVGVTDGNSSRPSFQFFHCCGMVGQDGSISSIAMNSYVMQVQIQVCERMASIEQAAFSEVLVSVAIATGRKQRVEVDVYPPDARFEQRELLIRQIAKIEVPPVQESPVAFAYYVQMRPTSVDPERSLTAFPSLKESITSLGIDAALRAAFDMAPVHESPMASAADRPQRTRWWEFLFWWRTPKPPIAPAIPSARAMFLAQEAWIQQAEGFAASSSWIELKRAASSAPSDFRYRLALAEKHRQHGAWESAIECYDGLIGQLEDCAPLAGRRAALHRRVGNSEAALMDCSRAIQQAPHEASFRVDRALIYCELAAWEAAMHDLDEAIRLNSLDPEAFFYRAQLHLQKNKMDAAADDFREAVRLDPNLGYAHFHLGWLYACLDGDKAEAAIEHLTRAIKLTDGSSEVRLHRSLAYLAQNKFALAMDDCQCVIMAEPENGFAHGIHGRILQCEGQFDDAIAACTRAVDLGFEHVSVYLARAMSYAATDQITLALADCDAALAIEPNSAWALQLQGRFKLQAGDLDAAMDAFHRARDLAPEWAEPREQISLVHRMKENPQAAVEEQTNLIANHPKQASFYVNRAFAFAQLQDYAEAANDYDRAIELEPDNEQIYYLRGIFRLNCQEIEPALADFERVLSITGNDDNARAYRASLLVQLKRYQEAIDEYGQLIAKYPEHPSAYSGRAFALASLGKSDQANEDTHRAIEMSPEQAEFIQRNTEIANLYRLTRAEDYDSALEAANQIIENYPDDVLGYRLRAYVFWEREEYVESFEDYTRVIEMSGPTPDCLSSRGQVQAELGEWDHALADLNQAVDMARQAGQTMVLAYALNGRSLTYAGMNRDQDSSRDFEESVQLCPTNPWVYYHRGIVKFKRNEFADAKLFLELALEFGDPPLSKRKKQRARTVLDKIASQEGS